MTLACDDEYMLTQVLFTGTKAPCVLHCFVLTCS